MAGNQRHKAGLTQISRRHAPIWVTDKFHQPLRTIFGTEGDDEAPARGSWSAKRRRIRDISITKLRSGCGEATTRRSVLGSKRSENEFNPNKQRLLRLSSVHRVRIITRPTMDTANKADMATYSALKLAPNPISSSSLLMMRRTLPKWSDEARQNHRLPIERKAEA